MNLIKDQGLPDFIMMPDDKVNMDGFLDNLKLRYEKKQIYTYIGEQLVAMNPYMLIEGLYSKEMIAEYQRKYLFEVQPHVFAVADDTFRSLMKTGRDQCVIVTGESGAGKTEASKIFMKYISAVSQEGHTSDDIKQKLLQSNPVLEAFGCAKTVRNNNSSRFGKYMEIEFGDMGNPLGGKISQYLLEKSRVTVRADTERSFHIFYQLLTDEKLLSSLNLSSDPSTYNYLASSGCYKLVGMDDAGDFNDVKNAMKVLGFSEVDMLSTWKILSAILNLGNIMFDEMKTTNNVPASQVQNMDVIEIVSELLSINAQLLARVLTSRQVTTGHKRVSVTCITFSPQDATKTRDSFAKALYTKIFSWVTDTVNLSMEHTMGKVVKIGVLDIYGFEIFEINSFEQFCINYCNEKLQQLFIKLVLKMEQEEYEREEIEWNKVDFFDNTAILSMIEGKGGIYKLLDEACLIGDKTPKSFLDKLDASLASKKHYESYKADPRNKKNKGLGDVAFRIIHYAGDVEYEVKHFIPRNQDTLYRDIVQTLQGSSDPVIRGFYPLVRTDRSGKKRKKRAKKSRPLTAGTQFTINLGKLIVKLQACQPHYIRCIKPNPNKKPFEFTEIVKEQVEYLNLVETVRVRKAGFCHRQDYTGWYRRYHMLSPKTWPSNTLGSDREGVKMILDDCKCEESEYKLGKTKLFVRNADTLFKLEDLRRVEMPKVATYIQCRYKGYRARVLWKRVQSACAIQRAWRVSRARITFKNLRAAVKIQTWYRRLRARRINRRLRSIIIIQKWVRRFVAQQKYKRLHSAIEIQRIWRGYVDRIAYVRRQKAIIIQRNFRGFNARRFTEIYKRRIKRRNAAIMVQKIFRGWRRRKWMVLHKSRLDTLRLAFAKSRQIQGSIGLQKLIRFSRDRTAGRILKARLTLQSLARGFLARRRLLAGIPKNSLSKEARNHPLKTLFAERIVKRWLQGHLQRMKAKRLRATIALQGFFRRWRLRVWVNLCLKTFSQELKVSNNFGKEFPWPSYGQCPLAHAQEIMKILWKDHVAKTRIAYLDPEENEKIRFKVRTLDIFGHKSTTSELKKPWNSQRIFKTDYNESPDPKKQAQYDTAIQHMFSKHDQEHIMFSDKVIKVNKKFKPQVQVVVVSLDYIFKYKPGNMKMIKNPIPLRDMTSIYMSKGTPDKWCVVKFQNHFRDMVLDLGISGEDRLSEFVTVLHERYEEQHAEKSGNFINFVDTITYNNSREITKSGKIIPGFDVNLTFKKAVEPPKQPGQCVFKGNKNGSTVFYP